VANDVGTYREYVTARLEPLRRTAYLLCGDWHTADDLVSVALTKLFRQWRRVAAMDNIDAYVRRTMLNAWLDERRRPWRREQLTGEVPDRWVSGPDSVQRIALMTYFDELPPRRRAVLVLRYFCDLSVEETADALSCSTGTVKSQTARALDSLRDRLTSAETVEGEALWT
jgi:RNA polymerase sigma-70 factor (sigma-E family)